MLKGIGLLITGAMVGAILTLALSLESRGPTELSEPRANSPSGSGRVSNMLPTNQPSSNEELLAENERLRSKVGDLEAAVRQYQGFVAYLQNPPTYRDQSVRTGGATVIKLMDGGFSRERAEELLERYSELNSQRVKASLELGAYTSSADAVLRQEIGDAEFEKFVIATDRVPAVQVGQLAGTSPAALFGLRTGDQIVSYDGHRLFDAREIASLSFQGTPDQTVILEIMRDSQLIQLAMPGGSLEAEFISNGFYVPASFVPLSSVEQ
jgi:hypothetical protein